MKAITQIIWMTACLLTGIAGFAQGTDDKRKTIDITSSFKPQLMPPKKVPFSASPLNPDGTRPAMTYNLPVQNLAFQFQPAPIRPLAFRDSLPPVENRAYVKLGYGNFATPYVKAAANYGNGKQSAGTVDANYVSSKGKLPYQEFARFGAGTSAMFQLNNNQELALRGGFQAHHTNRYGFRPDTLKPAADSLKLRYNDLHVGATLGNKYHGATGILYKASVDAHVFSDNNRASETAMQFDIPLEKQLNDEVNVQVGLSGLLNRLNNKNASVINSNLVMVRAGTRLKLTDDITLHAALIPSWNRGDFALLPDIEADIRLNDQDLIVQAGLKGSYIQNTFRTLAAYNPWMEQPFFLTNSRNTEFFMGVKAVLDEHISFRVKGGYQRRLNVPLFVNDDKDGRVFEMLWESAMNIVGVSGEFNWQLGQKVSWYNQLTFQSFGGLKDYDKAYGMLPVEYQSSVRVRPVDKLLIKGDLYGFGAAWHTDKGGKSIRGQKGTDISAGLEFELIPNARLWLQFQNILNKPYQRWNQYEVLGFQVLGGVILNL